MQEALSVYFPDTVQAALNSLDGAVKKDLREIRVRKGQALMLTDSRGSRFLSCDGRLQSKRDSRTVTIDENAFDELLMRLCDYSLYNRMEELRDGYITLSDGTRIGVASTAVYEDGKLLSVKDINALCIRIPRRVAGCADTVLKKLYTSDFPSIIIAGKPGSGKTTLLRELALSLAGGYGGIYRRIAVVDERGELAADDGRFMKDACCDVLRHFHKAKGIEIAARSLSPEMIICDEIADKEEVKQLLSAFSAGIRFALSMHIGTPEELCRKALLQELLSSGEFSYVVLLEEIGCAPVIYNAEEVYREASGNPASAALRNHDRLLSRIPCGGEGTCLRGAV